MKKVISELKLNETAAWNCFKKPRVKTACKLLSIVYIWQYDREYSSRKDPVVKAELIITDCNIYSLQISNHNGHGFLALLHHTSLPDIHFEFPLYATFFNRFAWNLAYRHNLSTFLEEHEVFWFWTKIFREIQLLWIHNTSLSDTRNPWPVKYC